MVSRAHCFSSVNQISSGQEGDRRQRAGVAVPSYLRTPLIALTVALAYYLGMKVGFLFTPAETPIGTLWPPNAILLAALLLAPTRIWPSLLLAVFPAHLIVQVQAGLPIPAALGWFAGNAGEALLGAVCIRHFTNKQRVFENLAGIKVFILFGVLLAPLATSFLDAAVAVLSGRASDYWMLWTTRLSSNMISEAIFVPIIVLIGLHGLSWVRTITSARWLEAILLAFGSAIVSMLVFGKGSLSTPALISAPLPFLVWAALRFGIGGLSASLLMISFISIWNATIGRGLLLRSSMTENVLFLHFFLLMFTLPLFLLVAAISEGRVSRESLRNTRSSLIAVQERERGRFGRELHENIAQQLTLLVVHFDQLKSATHATAGTELEEIRREVTQVFEATRDLSHELHPLVLEYLGLGAGLRSLCRRVAKQSGIDISFAEHNPSHVAQDASLCFYRITEEALRNIVKHSQARAAAVELTATDRSAVLRITDDGIGIRSEEYQGRGMGLANMRERAVALDGTCDIVSKMMSGTTITASVPLPPESRHQSA